MSRNALMNSPIHDIAILGSGPVGCAFALAMARTAADPGRILLAGPHHSPRPDGQAIDPRAIALNQGSRQFLEQLGAWPEHAADIHTVHVSRVGHAGRTRIDHRDLGVPRLGCVVAYDALLSALDTAVTRSGVARHPARCGPPLAGHPPRLSLGEGPLQSVRLAVVSDGRRPQGLARTYAQHAVVATVRASRPRRGWAFERFTRDGPLALLPHPAGGDFYSLVWCTRPERARSLSTLPTPAFDAQLQATFGARLGTLHRVSDSHTFPLSMHLGPSLPGPGIVAIGNAAQTLHPVAGQGLNLGLRDAAQLAQTLQPWLQRPDAPVTGQLERYARQRCIDRGVTLAFTDSLPRVFSSRSLLVREACGAGLLALDGFPFLRRPLARHLLRGQRL